MIDRNVIFGGRQVGKTYTIMQEINEWIVKGRRAEILVVFPTAEYVHWWSRMWQYHFHNTPMPEYITINNRLKVRGRFFSKVYVEDVDMYEHGIYDERLREIEVSLRTPLNDEEFVFTSSPIVLNQLPTPESVRMEYDQGLRRKAEWDRHMKVRMMLSQKIREFGRGRT